MFNFRKKLLYVSKMRGCKENDLILGQFAEEHLLEMSDTDLKIYEQILELPDADIYDYVTGKTPVPSLLQSNVMSKLINFKIKNK